MGEMRQQCKSRVDTTGITSFPLTYKRRFKCIILSYTKPNYAASVLPSLSMSVSLTHTVSISHLRDN